MNSSRVLRCAAALAVVAGNSNFGFCFSLWDRLLGTYRQAPTLGHVAMTIGIAELREPSKVVELKGMLSIPFDSSAHPDSIGTRSNRAT